MFDETLAKRREMVATTQLCCSKRGNYYFWYFCLLLFFLTIFFYKQANKIINKVATPACILEAALRGGEVVEDVVEIEEEEEVVEGRVTKTETETEGEEVAVAPKERWEAKMRRRGIDSRREDGRSVSLNGYVTGWSRDFSLNRGNQFICYSSLYFLIIIKV